MEKRKRKKKVELLNEKERTILMNKIKSTRKTGILTARLKQKYFDLDKTIDSFVQDAVLLANNYKFLPTKSDKTETEKIMKKEKKVREALIAMLSGTFDILKITSNEEKKAANEFIRKLLNEISKPEYGVNFKKEKAYEFELNKIRNKFSKKTYKMAAKLLICLRKLQDFHLNVVFLIEKNKITAIKYKKIDPSSNKKTAPLEAAMGLPEKIEEKKPQYKMVTLGDAITLPEKDEKLTSLINFCLKHGLLYRAPSEIESSFDRHEVMLSHMGYLVSIALDPDYEKDGLALFRIEEIISKFYCDPQANKGPLDLIK